VGTRHFIEREQRRQEARVRQGALYDGLYDGAVTIDEPPASVHLLNPRCDAPDATSRRFAQLEID
jgi:hypothetical protein